MDFTKVSGHTILYAITAIVVVIVAIAVRYACLVGGLDAGTAERYRAGKLRNIC